tara:strand:+ start:1160 stop:2131 length:972 start_codon:yes stop_codon:yes gene_type:complete
MGQKKPKVVIIGGVESSYICLKQLFKYNFDIQKVYGYQPKSTKNVSGFRDLSPFCDKNEIPFQSFKQINTFEDEIKTLDCEYIFVVGISQLVSLNIINSAKIGSIGFHPTNLPQGRGRAPLAWLVNDLNDGSATFFVLEETADTGAILDKRIFKVEPIDTAKDVENKMLAAMEEALDSLLPKLKKLWWDPKAQDEGISSEYGLRKPEDGLIQWDISARELERLIKAVAFPHPGAFTFLNFERINVLNAREEKKMSIKGVQGRVLKIKMNECLVQTADGLLWIEVDDINKYLIRVGSLLGYKSDLEIFKMKNEIKKLKKVVGLK